MFHNPCSAKHVRLVNYTCDMYKCKTELGVATSGGYLWVTLQNFCHKIKEFGDAKNKSCQFPVIKPKKNGCKIEKKHAAKS